MLDVPTLDNVPHDHTSLLKYELFAIDDDKEGTVNQHALLRGTW